MSFADDVSSNYNPKKKEPAKSINELRNECARILVSEAKRQLMLLAKAGCSNQFRTGFFGKKVNGVNVSFRIDVSPFNDVSVGYSYREYPDDDRHPEYLRVPNEKEAKAVFSIIQQLAIREGIKTERYSSFKTEDKANIRFWIEV